MKKRSILKRILLSLTFAISVLFARADVKLYGFTPDGKYLLVAKDMDTDHEVLAFYDAKTYQVVFSKPILSFFIVTYSKDGKLAAFYTDKNDYVTILDLTNFKNMVEYERTSILNATAYSVESEKDPFKQAAMTAFTGRSQINLTYEQRLEYGSRFTGAFGDFTRFDESAVLNSYAYQFSCSGTIDNESFKWDMNNMDKSFFGEWKKKKKDLYNFTGINELFSNLRIYIDKDYRKIILVSLFPDQVVARILNGRTGELIKDIKVPIPKDNKSFDKGSYGIDPAGSTLFYILPNENNNPVHALDLTNGAVTTAFIFDDKLHNNSVCPDNTPECFYAVGKKMIQEKNWPLAHSYMDSSMQNRNSFATDLKNGKYQGFVKDYILTIFHLRSHDFDGWENLLSHNQEMINDYFIELEKDRFEGDMGKDTINSFDYALFLLDPDLHPVGLNHRPYEVSQYNWGYEMLKRNYSDLYTYKNRRPTDKDNAGLYFGILYTMINEYKLGLDIFNSYIRSHDNDALAYFDRGVVKKLLNDATGSKADFDKAVQLDPAIKEISIHDRCLIRNYAGIYVTMRHCDNPEYELNQFKKIEDRWTLHPQSAIYDETFQISDNHLEIDQAVAQSKDGKKKYLYLKTSVFVEQEVGGNVRIKTKSYTIMPYYVYADKSLDTATVKAKLFNRIGKEVENRNSSSGLSTQYIESGFWSDCDEERCEDLIELAKKQKPDALLMPAKEIIID